MSPTIAQRMPRRRFRSSPLNGIRFHSKFPRSSAQGPSILAISSTNSQDPDVRSWENDRKINTSPASSKKTLAQTAPLLPRCSLHGILFSQPTIPLHNRQKHRAIPHSSGAGNLFSVTGSARPMWGRQSGADRCSGAHSERHVIGPEFLHTGTTRGSGWKAL